MHNNKKKKKIEKNLPFRSSRSVNFQSALEARFCAASCNRALDATRRDALAAYPILRSPGLRVCVCGGDVSGEDSGGRLHSVHLSLAATRMRPPAARTHATHADSPPTRTTTEVATLMFPHAYNTRTYIYAESSISTFNMRE